MKHSDIFCKVVSGIAPQYKQAAHKMPRVLLMNEKQICLRLLNLYLKI